MKRTPLLTVAGLTFLLSVSPAQKASNLYTVEKDVLCAETKELLLEGLEYAANDDAVGLQKFLDKKYPRVFTTLKDVKVFIIDGDKEKPILKVRVKGTALSFWVLKSQVVRWKP